MKNKKTVFGKNLKEMLKKRGLNQRELSELVGISQVMIHKIISGKSKNSTKLIQISKVLNCSPEWLLTGKGEPALKNSDNKPVGFISKKIIGSLSLLNLKEIIEMKPNNELGEILLPSQFMDDQRYFVIAIDTDSMTNENLEHSFKKMDFLVFDKNKLSNVEDYVLVYNNKTKSSVFRKLVKEGGKCFYEALNPKYPMVESIDDEEIIGVLAYYQPKGIFFNNNKNK